MNLFKSLHSDDCFFLLISGRLTFLFHIVYFIYLFIYFFREVVSNDYIDKLCRI